MPDLSPDVSTGNAEETPFYVPGTDPDIDRSLGLTADPPREDLVELAYTFQVPRQFTSRIHLRDVSAVAEITIVMVEGMPKIRAWHVECSEPVPPDLMKAVGPALVDFAVREQALTYSVRPSSFPEAQSTEELLVASSTEEGRRRWNEDEKRWIASADRAARAARTKRRVTPERLARVRALYETGGIPAVIDETGGSERNARRLLARAKKELP
jgi:hypothetical protein